MKTVTIKDWNIAFTPDQRLKFTGIIFHENGIKPFAYILNGVSHRELGPAIVYLNNFKMYYLHGVGYSEKQYWQIMLEKYRGTEHEAEILAEMLGA